MRAAQFRSYITQSLKLMQQTFVVWLMVQGTVLNGCHIYNSSHHIGTFSETHICAYSSAVMIIFQLTLMSD